MASFEEIEEEEEEEKLSIHFSHLNLEESFNYVEKMFNQMIIEMEDDPKLTPYIEPYSNLFDFVYSEHVKAMQLQDETVRLELEKAEGEARFIDSNNQLINDAIVIDALKRNINDTHLDLDNAHAREQLAQEVVDNLRRTISALEAEVEFKNKMAEIEADENPSVTKIRQGLERENMKLAQQVAKLNDKLDTALGVQEELEHRTDLTDVIIQQIIEQLTDTEALVEKARIHKEKLELELTEQKADLEKKTADTEMLGTFMNHDLEIIKKLSAEIKEQSEDIDKCSKTLETWNIKYGRLQMDYDVVLYKDHTVKTENKKNLLNRHTELDQLAELQADLDKVYDAKRKLEVHLEHMYDETSGVMKERGDLYEKIVEIDEDIIKQKLANDTRKREIINLAREKDIIRRNVILQSRINSHQEENIKNMLTIKNKIETELAGHCVNHVRQKKEIAYLSKEQERLKEEAEDNIKLIEEMTEKTRAKKLALYSFKKKMAAFRTQQRSQQNLLDACISDAKYLNKTHNDMTAQSQLLREKLFETKRFVALSVEQIASKVQEIVQIKKLLLATQNEIDDCKSELINCRSNIRILKRRNVELTLTIKSFVKNIEMSDQQIKASDKVIVALVNERDLLATQLYRRNQELVLLYSKVKVFQFTFEKGINQYSSRLTDIHLLKYEIKHLRQEKLLLAVNISNMNDMQTEIFHLEVDLNRERVKTRMLEEELRYPTNIHRWRMLEASSPEVFQGLQYILLLQKKVLSQSRIISQNQIRVRETKKLMNNFKTLVSKQPGPQMEEQYRQCVNKLAMSREQEKKLEAEIDFKLAENNMHNTLFHKKAFALRLERHKLGVTKKARKNLKEKEFKVIEKGQEILDNMVKLMQPKTVVAIAKKALRKENDSSSNS